MATATATGLSIEDFEKLSDEEAHYKELVNGELIDVSGNNAEHNLLRGELEGSIRSWVKEHDFGTVISEQEYDFGGNAHGPDITFFGKEKISLLDRKRRVQLFVPDLAIEIASPNDRHYDLIKKIRRYRRCGVAEVWLLTQSERQAEVFSASRNMIYFDDDAFDPGPLQGFSVPLRRLFDV